MSRLRSTRSSGAASGGSTARAAARGPRVAVAVPKSDIFVVMLGIALGAVVLSCILMLWILWRHDFAVSVATLRTFTAPIATILGLPVESLIQS